MGHAPVMAMERPENQVEISAILPRDLSARFNDLVFYDPKLYGSLQPTGISVFSLFYVSSNKFDFNEIFPRARWGTPFIDLPRNKMQMLKMESARFQATVKALSSSSDVTQDWKGRQQGY